MKTKFVAAVLIALSATAATHAGNVSWGVSVGSWGGGVGVGVSAGHGHGRGHYRGHGHGHGHFVPTVVHCAPPPAVVYAPAPVWVMPPPMVVGYAPVAPLAPVYVPAPVVVAPVCAPRFGFRARW